VHLETYFWAQSPGLSVLAGAPVVSMGIFSDTPKYGPGLLEINAAAEP